MRNHLVIFARAPRLGRVKRRLAADIGPVAVWAFYRACLAATVRRLAADRRWRTWLAVTPEPARWPAGVPRLAQSGGDLGARMRNAMAALPAGPAVLVGGDIPDIARADIAAAFRVLGARDAVFGPAPDGGYWLVGFRRRPVTPDPFAGVRWSGPHALADTLANLGPRFAHALVRERADVDDGRAYAVARRPHHPGHPR